MEENNTQPVSKLNPIVLIGIIIIVVIVLSLGAALFLLNKNSSSTNITQNQTNSQGNISPTSTSQTQSQKFSLADVAVHSIENDCWLIIDGGVYDVTKFIPRHPGGKEILQGCGKDATTMFNKRPNDGTSHSPRARELLTRYKIGDLKN